MTLDELTQAEREAHRFLDRIGALHEIQLHRGREQ
jgi:hypothetical protein